MLAAIYMPILEIRGPPNTLAHQCEQGLSNIRPLGQKAHCFSANLKFFGQLWCAFVFSRYVLRRGSVRDFLTSIYQKKRAEPLHLDFVNKKEKNSKKSFELLDAPRRFGNITNADGDRRATNCRRERGGNWRKSAQVEKRSGEPAQIAVRYPPRVRGYHPRGQTESRSGRLRGSNKKDRGKPLFFFAHEQPLVRFARWFCYPKPRKNWPGVFDAGRESQCLANWT